MSKEDAELQEIWKLFQDSDADIQQRRKEITKAIQSDTTLSDYPHHLSVVTAMDELFACFALGGQVRNYYRYGTYDSCDRATQKFWFALKHGSFFTPKEKPVEELSEYELKKRLTVQEFYKKRFLEDKANGSSEDIWERRKELLENPFKKEDDVDSSIKYH
ncbi:Early meiotic induction protein 1 [Candida viswanathii]|uniref:Early meiotic induction protein 1 n=1 Tax=Candida viswanathii TaxID=5486 RepID=A0A367XMQ7_9ASCO|nr:Early meiotic induction protein 1 [Candida viswanathii]